MVLVSPGPTIVAAAPPPGPLAAGRAKVIGHPFVFGCTGSSFGSDVHATDRIFKCCCHYVLLFNSDIFNQFRIYSDRFIRRNNWALIATMMVLRDISNAPTAGESRIPAQARTPAASGNATTL